jgi:hypothetical protein
MKDINSRRVLGEGGGIEGAGEGGGKRARDVGGY